MGVDELVAENGALRFMTTSDDPAIGVDAYANAADYDTVVVRMKLTGAAAATDDAYFFWARPSGEMRASTSVGFTVTADGQFHTYEAPLGGHRFWRGETKALRLDPVSQAGVEVVIDEIRLE
jgi:hypothetical protein